MADPEVDVKALAELARLEVTDAELAKLEQEIPDILKFVETIQSANVSVEAKSPELRNVMRPDENPHESGIYTERLIKAAPKSEKDRVVVKQVVSRKKN
jgi:aspartyl/glutamyl-tRNA(Asn/Gln) amidotransferase C subunit